MDDKEYQYDKLNIPSEKDSMKALLSKELVLEERFQGYDNSGNRDNESGDKRLSSFTTPPLDQIISTIDGEIEEAYGQVVMADFGTHRKEAAKGQERCVVFSLHDTKYAASIANVIEIGRLINVTPIPNLPVWLRGVTNIRGDILSVIDLGLFLGIERIAQLDSSIMLVVRAGGEEVSTVLIVDQVKQILNVSKNRIGTPTAPILDNVVPFLRGVYEHDDQLLLVLDLERFLRLPEIRQFE